MPIVIPPIKSQGIKTKLVPWINNVILQSGVDLEHANWIEPFFGTGVVGLNAPVRGCHIVGDTNPHLINLYQSIQNGVLNEYNMRAYLEHESRLLGNADEEGYAYYREVKSRFNREHSPFDFIFLSRAGFNGMMRFNRRGEWNIPFCQKPGRFAPAYITKICNQVANARRIIHRGNWEFLNQGFLATIERAEIIHDLRSGKFDVLVGINLLREGLDLPEVSLIAILDADKEGYDALLHTPGHFILSTWHHNEFRENEMMKRFWNQFNVITQEHFYHGGGHIENRHPMVEALVFNFELQEVYRQEEVVEPELAFA